MTSVDERGTPQSQSELEEGYTDSDYSPGSLMIDIGAEGRGREEKGEELNMYMYKHSCKGERCGV